jgi:hypothetical protein
MRQKSLGVQGENVRLGLNIRRGLRYVKSILAFTENTLKEYKHLRRILQEYFAVHGEYADRHKIEPISANFRPKQKKIRF